MIMLGDDPSFDIGGSRYADRQGAAAFGRVVRGLDNLRKLGSTPARIESVSIADPFKPR
jgi:peptidyl-prolyl cis-trans isomerase A (cyclophilin A)